MKKEKEKGLVFLCPYCKAQNFVSLERLKIKDSPLKCWVCSRDIPREVVEKQNKQL